MSQPHLPDISERYFNREISWLQFNQRVMDMVSRQDVPLLERVRYLAISASNLDEFYAVRVAGLEAMLRRGIETLSIDKLSPSQQLDQIYQITTQLLEQQQILLNDLLSQMAAHNIHLLTPETIDPEDIIHVQEIFQKSLFPILTPSVIDKSHPLPYISHQDFALILKLRKQNNKSKMLIMIPSQLPRFWRLPDKVTQTEEKNIRYMTIENIILMNLSSFFPGHICTGYGSFKILRDSDIEIEEEAEDLVREFESALQRRRLGHVVRLKILAATPPDLVHLLTRTLNVQPRNITYINGLSGISTLAEMIPSERSDLLYPLHTPVVQHRAFQRKGDIFALLRKQDLLLHHPYESFETVIHFLRQAARDEQVIAIKQTLYRTSDNSPIIAALIEAAERGKSVTALIELKARFDESANLQWARDLERAGVHVVFGFIHLKTHAKTTIILRRENDIIQIYTHFGTGNYHPNTARIYTDLSYLTSNHQIGDDAVKLFNYTTSYIRPEKTQHIIISPIAMKQKLLNYIAREADFAGQGKPAMIQAKMNSLVDPDIIDALYIASQAGVQIDLIIRGICCLRPGMPGISDNITVKSIVGRFLEHSRIICFGNGYTIPHNQNLLFMSSADWMPRNLERRVEAMIPILDNHIKQDVSEIIMHSNLTDQQCSWYLKADGQYISKREGDNVHKKLIQHYHNRHRQVVEKSDW